jgi:hypothetical protein
MFPTENDRDYIESLFNLDPAATTNTTSGQQGAQATLVHDSQLANPREEPPPPTEYPVTASGASAQEQPRVIHWGPPSTSNTYHASAADTQYFETQHHASERQWHRPGQPTFRQEVQPQSISSVRKQNSTGEMMPVQSQQPRQWGMALSTQAVGDATTPHEAHRYQPLQTGPRPQIPKQHGHVRPPAPFQQAGHGASQPVYQHAPPTQPPGASYGPQFPQVLPTNVSSHPRTGGHYWGVEQDPAPPLLNRTHNPAPLTLGNPQINFSSIGAAPDRSSLGAEQVGISGLYYPNDQGPFAVRYQPTPYENITAYNRGLQQSAAPLPSDGTQYPVPLTFDHSQPTLLPRSADVPYLSEGPSASMYRPIPQANPLSGDRTGPGPDTQLHESGSEALEFSSGQQSLGSESQSNVRQQIESEPTEESNETPFCTKCGPERSAHERRPFILVDINPNRWYCNLHWESLSSMRKDVILLKLPEQKRPFPLLDGKCVDCGREKSLKWHLVNNWYPASGTLCSGCNRNRNFRNRNMRNN